MKKVLVFGTFDILHPGHEHFLMEAKRYGDALTAVVARDTTVEKLKGREPLFTENVRILNLERMGIADAVRFGYEDDKMQIIREENPSIICLGYDQKMFVEEMKMTFPAIEIKKLAPHEPEQYKSSKYRSAYIQGVVVKGKGIGKQIGYPTANLQLADADQEHEPGVFASSTWIGSEVHPSITIIGARKEDGKALVEVYFLSQQGDIYGQELITKIEYKVREMEFFDTEEGLLAQIKKDIEYVHRNRPKYWESISSGKSTGA